jgi:hypothetical protein
MKLSKQYSKLSQKNLKAVKTKEVYKPTGGPMFKYLITITVFLSAQLTPLYSFADDAVVSEFQRSANEMAQKVAAQKAAADKADKILHINRDIRNDTIILSARLNELETLGEQIPNVREDVVENSARALKASEINNGKENLFETSAVIAVASGIIYSLTKVDVAKVFVTAKEGATARVKPNAVNRALRNVYKNKNLARGTSVIGVLAALVAGGTYLEMHTLSVDEANSIRGLENTYLSQLVTGGKSEHLSDTEIHTALVKNYNDDPAFRDAVVNEVKTIVAETERLNSEINTKKQDIQNSAKL